MIQVYYIYGAFDFCYYYIVKFVVQLLNVWLFMTPRTAACQASLSFTISWSFRKLMSIESVMLSNHLILCHPVLPPSVFPSIRVSSYESALCIRWPDYWSFSIIAIAWKQGWTTKSFLILNCSWFIVSYWFGVYSIVIWCFNRLYSFRSYFLAVYSLSGVWLCNPMDCLMPGFHVLHHLLELAQTHIHWVGDAIQPSHPLSSPNCNSLCYIVYPCCLSILYIVVYIS